MCSWNCLRRRDHSAPPRLVVLRCLVGLVLGQALAQLLQLLVFALQDLLELHELFGLEHVLACLGLSLSQRGLTREWGGGRMVARASHRIPGLKPTCVRASSVDRMVTLRDDSSTSWPTRCVRPCPMCRARAGRPLSRTHHCLSLGRAGLGGESVPRCSRLARQLRAPLLHLAVPGPKRLVLLAQLGHFLRQLAPLVSKRLLRTRVRAQSHKRSRSDPQAQMRGDSSSGPGAGWRLASPRWRTCG